ncbi:MAG: response regulator [Cyanobacteria bacterium J06621_8]
MIRTIVVDDQNVILEGIKVLLETATEVEIVASARDGETALAKIADLKPDVVLLDINLPGISGLTVASKISSQYPEVKVIVLSSYEDDSYVSQAMGSGAKGYLLKSVSAKELEWSIKLVYQGYSAFKSELLASVTADEKSQQNLSQPTSELFPAAVSRVRSQAVNSEPELAPAPVRVSENARLSANLVSDTPLTPKEETDPGLVNMEALLSRNHTYEQYSKYAVRGKHHRGNRIINHVKLNQIKKTLTSFEFKFLTATILFCFGFLVFVALS